jgi:hypothetical protein
MSEEESVDGSRKPVEVGEPVEVSESAELAEPDDLDIRRRQWRAQNPTGADRLMAILTPLANNRRSSRSTVQRPLSQRLPQPESHQDTRTIAASILSVTLIVVGLFFVAFSWTNSDGFDGFTTGVLSLSMPFACGAWLLLRREVTEPVWSAVVLLYLVLGVLATYAAATSIWLEVSGSVEGQTSNPGIMVLVSIGAFLPWAGSIAALVRTHLAAWPREPVPPVESFVQSGDESVR